MVWHCFGNYIFKSVIINLLRNFALNCNGSEMSIKESRAREERGVENYILPNKTKDHPYEI
jgi:hypothetical protein